MSCMVVPWSEFQLGKGPKRGSQSPLMSFARGSLDTRDPVGARFGAIRSVEQIGYAPSSLSVGRLATHNGKVIFPGPSP